MFSVYGLDFAMCAQNGSESRVAVVVATDSELLCFYGFGGIAAAFSSNSNKNPHAAVSDAVAYEVSAGISAAAASAPSCIAIDRINSTDPHTAAFTVYWLTP